MSDCAWKNCAIGEIEEVIAREELQILKNKSDIKLMEEAIDAYIQLDCIDMIPDKESEIDELQLENIDIVLRIVKLREDRLFLIGIEKKFMELKWEDIYYSVLNE